MNQKHISETQELACEEFAPLLNEFYQNQYLQLLSKLEYSLPISRVSIIEDEIDKMKKMGENNDIDSIRYLATLHVLVDLSQQGWIFVIENQRLVLKMENDILGDKEKIRYRLSAEKNAQFKCASIRDFIRTMETPKMYKGNTVCVKNLIGDKHRIIEAIENNSRICDPYIQMVSNDRDEFTGLKLSDIWRYFRYTWSIPYKTMPGRNLFYLVRDRNQPFHPIVGIFALGNSVLNLTVRDNDIGWTVDSIKRNMNVLTEETICEQIVAGTNGRTIKTKISLPLESREEYTERATLYANQIYPLLIKGIENAISEIYLKDLGYHRNTKYPTQDKIDELLAMAQEYAAISINNKNNEENPNWEEEAQSNLFKRKRAAELAKLLSTKRTFNNANGSTPFEKLNSLLSTESGRKAIHTALIANRKTKIGSNMMEIIVCGSIPPYNEILGGKLISILASSPTVVRDYTIKYQNQISEIASRMKGKKVVRDSSLAYLGTTSLYAIGSSQYNRIKVPCSNGFVLEFREMGVTEGFGTVFFSKETTSLFSKMLEIQDGGKKISHVFGEGTSPRFRMISRGLSSLGVKSEAFLRHHSPRIVYSINLAKNTNEFLMGLDDYLEYEYDIHNSKEVDDKTQELIEYWYNRWCLKRLTTVDIKARLEKFDPETIVLGNI